MLLPKPVVLAGLLIAYCLGQFICWLEQARSKRHTAAITLTDGDKVIASERLA